MLEVDPKWVHEYNSYDPEKEKNSETLCTVGNGYMGTRGSFPENSSGDLHSPGTYIAGIFNAVESEVVGRTIINEDFVNCPNWTSIKFRINGNEWFNLDKCEIIEYKKQLNMRKGMLSRLIKVKDCDGNISIIENSRFISMASAHCAVQYYTITAENYSGTIELQSALDGEVKNDGVSRYSQLNNEHLISVSENAIDGILQLAVKTSQSDITIVMVARHAFTVDSKSFHCDSVSKVRDRYCAFNYSFNVNVGSVVKLEKTVSIFTSRDDCVDQPVAVALSFSEKLPTANVIFEKHCLEWQKIWDNVDISIDGDDETERILRLHTYHLLVTASVHNCILDVSIPARGLHGEAYRGHIFWDTLFVFPFYFMHFPNIARALLMYRYNRLDAARQYANEYGYKGAMYPWQSASSGKEETQVVHLNPVSGEWGEDYSSLQRHVSLAIAYNTWMYYWHTEDREFLTDYGAELLFEITRFWSSKATLNKVTGRYEIKKVMGPNEYHEMMHGSNSGGLKDNAYTNVLVAWLMEKSLQVRKILDPEKLLAIDKKIVLTEDEPHFWKILSRKINLVIKDGIIAQYDGFLELKELDWQAYRKKYGSIGRLDRILKAEGLSPDDYQLTKQADLLMLFYILPTFEVESVITNLGYRLESDYLKKNYDYYLARTSHGSTLSLVVHAHIASILKDQEHAKSWFSRALNADIDDIQGGTVQEGIHTGLMAGTITLFLSSIAGLNLLGDSITFAPELPKQYTKVSFKFVYRSVSYAVSIDHAVLLIISAVDVISLPSVYVNGLEYLFDKDGKISVML